jgi:xanthine/CO dehydrogenase XdhC/CoxF family maturation factor
LVTGQGEWVGGVSGGCLEGDLVRKAWWRTEAGPTLVTYDSTADDDTAWQFGLGCNGAVHVLHERLTPGGKDPLAFIGRCLQGDEPGLLATVFRADEPVGVALGTRLTLTAGGTCDAGALPVELAEAIRRDAVDCLAQDRSQTARYPCAAGEVEVFLEVVRPPHRLIVFGAGFDAVPVVHAAKALGWHVTVVDRRPGYARQPGFAAADAVIVAPPTEAGDRLRFDRRTAAVVMAHDFPDDRAAVELLLPTTVRYIGVLGPKSRTDKMLAEVAAASGPVSQKQLARLYSPVGLDIGADAPEEIAAAIVAQIVAVFAGYLGGHLRDRGGPIHRRDPAGKPGTIR